MTSDKTIIQARAERMRACFELRTVKRGAEAKEERIWSLKEEHRGGEAQSLAMDAHGGMLPDDWKYEYIVDALDALVEHEDTDEARDALPESDVYHSDLLRWVSSHLERAGYVDEFTEEMEERMEMFASMQGGQRKEREEVFGLVLSYLEGMEDEDEEEAEEVLPSENPETPEADILMRARDELGADRELVAHYEHGQWWVEDAKTGAQWSVCDAEIDGEDTFVFEEVSRGEEE